MAPRAESWARPLPACRRCQSPPGSGRGPFAQVPWCHGPWVKPKLHSNRGGGGSRPIWKAGHVVSPSHLSHNQNSAMKRLTQNPVSGWSFIYPGFDCGPIDRTSSSQTKGGVVLGPHLESWTCLQRSSAVFPQYPNVPDRMVFRGAFFSCSRQGRPMDLVNGKHLCYGTPFLGFKGKPKGTRLCHFGAPCCCLEGL